MLNFRHKEKNLASLTEEHYKEKETTRWTLCRDVYEIGKSGVLTASLSALCLGSSSAFGVGAYSIFDRLFANGARLTDEAIPLTLFLGVFALASGFGTKLMHDLTEQEYHLLKKHYRDYKNKI